MPDVRSHSSSAPLLLLLAAVLIGGCAGGYDHRFAYDPHPLAIEMPIPDDAAAGTARTLVSVIGLQRPDESIDRPAAIEIRMRIDNGTNRDIRFDPGSLELVAGNLEPFGPPLVETDAPLTVAPETKADIVARFVFPGNRYPGSFDLQGLDLSWDVDVGDRAVAANAVFTRRRYDDRLYRRYWAGYDPYGYGWGCRYGLPYRGYGYWPRYRRD